MTKFPAIRTSRLLVVGCTSAYCAEENLQTFGTPLAQYEHYNGLTGLQQVCGIECSREFPIMIKDGVAINADGSLILLDITRSLR